MYLRILKNVHAIHSRKISNKSTVFYTQIKYDKEKFLKKPLPKDLVKLYGENKQHIFYSSYIENNKIHLSYNKQKFYEYILKKQEKQNKIENAQVKPFPTSLNYLLNTDSTEENDGKNSTDNITGDKHLSSQLSDPDERQSLIQYLNDSNNELEGKTSPELNITHNKERLKLLNLFKTDYNEGNKMKNSKTFDNINDPDRRPVTSNWMRDYEIFDESIDKVDSEYGTPDPSVPVSKVICFGCGSYLHCVDSSLPGYLPSELFVGQSDDSLRVVPCQRCHFLKKYNTAINVTVPPEQYIQMISTIADKTALAILMVDLLDFPCSIWPDIREILGKHRPIFIVGNKVDLLPKDSRGYLNHIKSCLTQNIIDSGISKINIKHICLISAQTGFGVEELITKLHSLWQYKGDVYLIGCTNVGKSTLFNALLRSDYCKVEASNIIQKATASQWPGTTLRLLKFPILRPSDMRLFIRQKRITSERSQKFAEDQLRREQAQTTKKVKYATLIGHIGTSFHTKEPIEKNDPFGLGKNANSTILHIDEQSDKYRLSKWCYDTPGVFHNEQILNLLTTEELLLTIPKEMIRPRTFMLKIGMSLFLAGLGRIDYLGPSIEKVRVLVYSSLALPIVVTSTESATNIYNTFLGTKLFGVPFGDIERLNKWPNLECSDVEYTVEGNSYDVSCCDILLSSAGWVGVNLPSGSIGKFKIWTPYQRGIIIRKPSLIPYGIQLKGNKIRGSLAYQIGSAFIREN